MENNELPKLPPSHVWCRSDGEVNEYPDVRDSGRPFVFYGSCLDVNNKRITTWLDHHVLAAWQDWAGSPEYEKFLRDHEAMQCYQKMLMECDPWLQVHIFYKDYAGAFVCVVKDVNDGTIARGEGVNVPEAIEDARKQLAAKEAIDG